VSRRRLGPAAAVDAAVQLVSRHPDRTVWIGVDGFGGSGKSTLAARIGQAIPHAAVVHVDDFAGPDIPEWDWERFRGQVLVPLLDGRPAHYQRWDWDSNSAAEWHDIAPGRPVVVEGVSSTRREVAAPWQLTVWVDAPREIRIDRAVERDGEAMLPKWLNDWMPSEDAYAEREQPQSRVDLVVSGVTDAITVRSCDASDLDALARCLPTPAEVWEAHLSRQDEGLVVLLGAWVGERPIGTVLLDRRAPAVTTPLVPSAMRGHGAGTLLVETAERLLAAARAARPRKPGDLGQSSSP
jgi:uridine kinase